MSSIIICWFDWGIFIIKLLDLSFDPCYIFLNHFYSLQNRTHILLWSLLNLNYLSYSVLVRLWWEATLTNWWILFYGGIVFLNNVEFNFFILNIRLCIFFWYLLNIFNLLICILPSLTLKEFFLQIV